MRKSFNLLEMRRKSLVNTRQLSDTRKQVERFYILTRPIPFDLMDGAKKRVNRSSNFFMMKRLSQKIHTDFDGRMALSFFGITEPSGIMH